MFPDERKSKTMLPDERSKLKTDWHIFNATH
jgi:hypothetical protein